MTSQNYAVEIQYQVVDIKKGILILDVSISRYLPSQNVIADALNRS